MSYILCVKTTQDNMLETKSLRKYLQMFLEYILSAFAMQQV